MPNPPFSTIPQMTFKPLSSSDSLPIFLEKAQFNFDQILLNGGGPKGDKGDKGDKGLPGATGIGQQGLQGRRGTFITFTGGAIINGQIISDPNVLEYDVIVDNDGDYFQAVVNPISGLLEWQFQFNLSTVSTSSYWIDQDSYYSVGNPINEWLRLDEGTFNQNLFVAKRFDKGGGFDRSDFYRLIIGMDTYPYGIPEVSMVVCNVLPNNTNPATSSAFYQFALKYREDAFTNPGANSVFFKYVEQPLVYNRYLFQIDNASVSTYANHDTLDTDNSFYAVRGHHFKLIGKSTNIDSITEWIDFQVDANLTTITSQKDLTIKPDGVLSAVLSLGYDEWIIDPVTGSGTTTIKYNDFIFDTVSGSVNSIELLQNFLLVQTGSVVDLDLFNIELGKTGLLTTITIEEDLLIQAGSNGDEVRFETDVHIDRVLSMGAASTDVYISVGGNLDVGSSQSSIIYVAWTGNDVITNIINGKPEQVLILTPTLNAVGGVSDPRQGFFINNSVSNIKLGNLLPNGDTFIGKQEQIMLYTPDGSTWYEFGNPKNGKGSKIITPDSSKYGDFDNLGDMQGYFTQNSDVDVWANGSPSYNDADVKNGFITEVITNANIYGTTIQIQYGNPFEGGI